MRSEKEIVDLIKELKEKYNMAMGYSNITRIRIAAKVDILEWVLGE